MSRGLTFVLGVAVGALGVALLQRLQQVVREDDPELLADDLARKLQQLETRTTRSGS